MSYRTGIQAAQDGKTIDDTPLAYDSSYGHLMVDIRDEVGHIGIYEGYCGTQTLTIANGFLEEIFLTIPHNLPFIPRVTAYMLIRDAPAFMAPLIGWYAGGHIFYGGVPMSEIILVRVDEKNVYFVHRSGTIDGNAYASQLQAVLIRAKYIINTNEMAGAPYEITYPSI